MGILIFAVIFTTFIVGVAVGLSFATRKMKEYDDTPLLEGKIDELSRKVADTRNILAAYQEIERSLRSAIIAKGYRVRVSNKDGSLSLVEDNDAQESSGQDTRTMQ